MCRFSKFFFQTLAFVLILNVKNICALDEDDEDIFRPIEHNLKNLFRQALPRFTESGLTALGTKWCGPGNTASNYDDLGSQNETDVCCREHDHCDEILEADSTLHGIKNTDMFPILKCSCEQKFVDCLHTADTLISHSVGALYYGARSKCLAFGHPIVSCKHYQEDTFSKRCLSYIVDKRRPKIWQFYEMPFFLTITIQTLGVLLILNVNNICAFDESIFEDEDIYRQALPPVTQTGLTAPGTKWCGPGNTASNYNDLGSQRETDMCCRDHDHCDEILEPDTTLHGLNNTDWFPILKCTCEQKFINCLQTVDTIISNTLGRLYYGTRSKCLANGHPIISCKQYMEGTLRKRCIRYNVDKKKSKIWQFYDMPFFTVNTGVKLSGLHKSPALLCLMLFNFLYYSLE